MKSAAPELDENPLRRRVGCDFLYVFGPDEHCGSDVIVKIGYTGDPKTTLTCLRRGNPFYSYWHVLHFPELAHKLEKAVHYVFRDRRVSGEFFALNHREIHLISRLSMDLLHSDRFNLSLAVYELRCLVSGDDWAGSPATNLFSEQLNEELDIKACLSAGLRLSCLTPNH